MGEPFAGVVKLDIRDSTPHGAPFSQPVATPGTAAVVYVVLDDVGFGALSCYGGLIDTPTIDRIAAAGLTVGRDSGEPLTDDYPGEAPWRFTGGTLHRVAVDVPGAPYVDLERGAVAMLARE